MNIITVKKTLFTVAIATILASRAEAQGVPLPSGQLATVGRVQCGQINGSWIPGKILKTGNFLSFAAQIKDLNKKLKRATKSSLRSKLATQISGAKTKLKRQRKTCAGLIGGTPNPSPTAPPVAQTPAPGAREVAWTQTAADLVDTVGQTYLYFCPPAGPVASIWGTDYYTSDSSVCNAAVHAGIISRFSGGNALFRMVEGRPFYIGSVANGETSSPYGSWGSSFVFLDQSTGAEILRTSPPVIAWTTNLSTFRSLLYQRFVLTCAANGSIGSLWGTDVYTNDSSVCTAALHSGLVSLRNGGTVTVEILPGQSSYSGTTRNGVTSRNYGPWGGSIGFVR
jgi:hypothetical protein